MPDPTASPAPTLDELAAQVLMLAQSRLTADLRFLSSSLEQLKPVPAPSLDALAIDGRCLYYPPEALLRAFRAQQSAPTRALLHVTLHCLLGHPFQRQEKDRRLWDIACDIAVEEVIRELNIPACALPDDAAQDDWRSRLRDTCPHLTAEEFYNFLLERQYPADVLAELTQLFSRDSHALWYAAPRAGASRSVQSGALLPTEEPDDTAEDTELRKTDGDDETLQQLQKCQNEALRKRWKQLARQAKTDLETFSRRHGKRAGALMDGLEPITFEECDYTEFLRRFGAQNEVMQLSEDEFDLIYYTYGLRTYGNIPLIEPLEYRDDKRIREFVIAIDTSGSVQGDIVQSFLQRTCNVLRQSGSFTSQVEIYLIQCDAEVQSVERLTSLDQLDELIAHLKLRGFGGTDFRPVFTYVDKLLREKKLTNLNGLLYFTDGVGTYPEKAPDYKTAFVFNRDDHLSPHVPSWAIRAVLTTDNIRLLHQQDVPTEEDTPSWT